MGGGGAAAGAAGGGIAISSPRAQTNLPLLGKGAVAVDGAAAGYGEAKVGSPRDPRSPSLPYLVSSNM